MGETSGDTRDENKGDTRDADILSLFLKITYY